MRNMSVRNGTAGGQPGQFVIFSLRPCCHSDSACFRNICVTLRLSNESCNVTHYVSLYHVMLRFMTMKFTVSSKLSCFLQEVGVSKVAGLY